MPLAEGHLDLGGEDVESGMLQRLDHLIRGRELAAVGLHGLVVGVLGRQDTIGVVIGRRRRRLLVHLAEFALEPVVERGVDTRRVHPIGTARELSLRELVAEPVGRYLAHREDELLALEQSPGCALGDEGLEVAAPEARVHQLLLGPEQNRDLGAVLAGEQLGELLLLGRLDFRRQGLHGQVEIAPGILAPGVVLVDAHVAVPGLAPEFPDDVARRAHIAAGAVVDDAEEVLRLLHQLLEDARRAAYRQQSQDPKLLRHPGDGGAAPGGDVAHHDVHALLLHLVAQLRDLLGAAAGFVVHHEIYLAAGQPDTVVGRRQGALVDGADHQVHTVLGRDAVGRRAAPGKERRNRQLDGLRRGGARRQQHRQSRGQRHESCTRNWGHVSLPCFLIAASCPAASNRARSIAGSSHNRTGRATKVRVPRHVFAPGGHIRLYV